MEYKELSELRNVYPSDAATVSNSYKTSNGSITYTGKYPENFIKFTQVSIADIQLGSLQTDSTIGFRFIVQFIENDQIENWTSAPFLAELEKSILDNNPYFTKNTVTIAQVDFTKLSTYYQVNKFSISENYAEVSVVDTILTREDMLKHINWLVGSDEKIRNVYSFGSWNVYHNPEGTMGFEFTEQIDQLANGEINGEIIGNTDLENVILTNPRTEKYQPFGSSGNYIGETRMFNGSPYEWTSEAWIKK